MRSGLLSATLLLVCGSLAEGRTIYVDSRSGNNAFDGTSAAPLNAYVGPVRTLQRGIELVQQGDSLVLADNGTPYYGSATLFGPRFSGTPTEPFRLIGNGAVISGTKPIAPQSWVEVRPDVWRVTPYRKGWYQLVEEGVAVPRVEIPATGSDLQSLPVGSWGVSRGSIYYRAASGDLPAWHPFELAETEAGLLLLDVRNVVISNVTFRHFRIDGINVHDRCANVLFDGVVCAENGRAGLAMGGTSRVQLRNSHFLGNQRHSLLVTGFAEASSEQSQFDRPPTIGE